MYSMVAQIEAVQNIKLVNPTPSTVQGLIQVFTASERIFYVDVIAQAMRLGGQGALVCIAQFFKGGICQGVKAPRKLGQNLEWLRCDLSRNIDADIELMESESKAILDLWGYVKYLIASAHHELIILDDLNLAIERSLISELEIIDTLKNRPPKLDIILTGANMPDSLIDIADRVTKRRR